MDSEKTVTIPEKEYEDLRRIARHALMAYEVLSAMPHLWRLFPGHDTCVKFTEDVLRRLAERDI